MGKREAGRLGGKATVRKYGRDHMSKIGKLGFQATMVALAARQQLDPKVPYDPFKNLMRNLKAKKGRW